MNSVFHPFPSELHLDGNYLQCSGALALLRPVAEYAEMQGKDQPDTRNPSQQPQGKCWGTWLHILWDHLQKETVL